MDTEPRIRRTGLIAAFSLAKLIHDKSERWEIERVERSTQWVAVLRDSGDDYIRIVAGQDLGALRFNWTRLSAIRRKKARRAAQASATGVTISVTFCPAACSVT